ncbi:tryptophan--tRNA ligase [Streptomyces sp. NPDC001665]
MNTTSLTASLTTPSSASADSLGLSQAQKRSAELEMLIVKNPGRFRVLTGDRPTGRLHLGHYFGTLHNRVRLQNLGVELYVVIADYQVLTDRDIADDLTGHVEDLVLDYLAIGVDPARSTIFTHSAVPALNQLLLPFLSLVTVADLERNPTVKDEISYSRQSTVSGLMFTYPAHQAADILFCKANLVPVGKDQLPHLELTRTIARRFNDRYSAGSAVFPRPDALLSNAPLLLGTDGGKMSKSRGNAIARRCSAFSWPSPSLPSRVQLPMSSPQYVPTPGRTSPACSRHPGGRPGRPVQGPARRAGPLTCAIVT